MLFTEDRGRGRFLRWVVFVVALLPALLGSGVGAVQAYDASHSDVLAEGIVVAGVEVGGLSVTQARAVLGEVALPRLARPVVVRHGKKTFALSPREADVRLDVDATLAAALTASRNGTLIDRVERDLSGRRLPIRFPLRVTYSHTVVSLFAGRVAQRLHRPARNARVVPGLARLRKAGGRNGRVVRTGALERAIGARLVDAQLSRTVRAPTAPLPPRITRRELAKRYPYFITISRGERVLRLFRRLKPVKRYRIAVGSIGYSTPSGLYKVENKAINPAWHVPRSPWTGSLAGQIIPGGAANNPLKARWMGFYGGAGIHGTSDVGSLGSAASHGCIRMAVPDVIELYAIVPVKTPIYIA